MGTVLHNFDWTNFSLLFVANFQATDISCKKYSEISQSKIMQHYSYLGWPLNLDLKIILESKCFTTSSSLINSFL